MEDRSGDRCLWLGFAANLILMVGKLAGGIFGLSQALIADGLNSFLDVVAGAVSLIGYRVAARPPDKDHHYGHQNAETVAAFVVGVAILATGAIIVRDAIATLWTGSTSVPRPWTIAIAAAVILIKLGLYLYTRRVAARTRSLVVSATAADHIMDVVATGGALIGVAGAQWGMPFLDPIAAFWVAAVILHNGVRIMRENVSVLLGSAPADNTIEAITATLRSAPGVRGLHRTKVRRAGKHFLVDTEVLVDGSLSVEEAHEIATAASDRVLAAHPLVADIVVHVEPHSDKRAAEGSDPMRSRFRPQPLSSGGAE